MNTNDNIDFKKELANHIKQARTSAHLDIDDVIKKTALSKDTILQIEGGKSIKGNSNTMMRIIIIKYLKFLDIYNQENIDLLDLAYPSNIDQITHTVNLENELNDITFDDEIKKNKKIQTTKKNAKLAVIVVSFLLISGVLIFVLYKNFTSKVETVTENETTLVANEVLEPQEIIDTKPKVNIETKKVNGNETYIVSGADNYEVNISFSGDAYLESSTNSKITPKVYKQGEEINLELKAGDKLALNTGKSENIIITINGQQMPQRNIVGVDNYVITFSANEEGNNENK